MEESSVMLILHLSTELIIKWRETFSVQHHLIIRKTK